VTSGNAANSKNKSAGKFERDRFRPPASVFVAFVPKSLTLIRLDFTG
jgi:hypothetical protein